jgi:hypothetical protein
LHGTDSFTLEYTSSRAERFTLVPRPSDGVKSLRSLHQLRESASEASGRGAVDDVMINGDGEI